MILQADGTEYKSDSKKWALIFLAFFPALIASLTFICLRPKHDKPTVKYEVDQGSVVVDTQSAISNQPGEPIVYPRPRPCVRAFDGDDAPQQTTCLHTMRDVTSMEQ